MAERMAVESPERAQPDEQAGSCSAVPLMSWPSARKVLLPVPAVTLLGDGAAVAEDAVEDGADAGALAAPEGRDDIGTGEPAGALAVVATGELAEELQAGTTKATPASTTPALSCRALRELGVDIKFHSLTFPSGSSSQVKV